MRIQETWGRYLEKCFEENLNRIAVIDISNNARYTYRDLMIQIQIFEKAFISYGVKRGYHVALIFSSSAIWIVAFLALVRIGGIPVCLNNDMTDGEIRNNIMDSDSRLVITDEEAYVKIRLHEREMDLKQVVIVDRRGFCSEELHCSIDTFLGSGKFITEEMVEEAHNAVQYDDILSMQYTSGTTGKPKAVMTVHYKVLSSMIATQEIVKYTKEDKILTSLPMYHIMGCFHSCLLPFCVGASIVLMNRFNSKRAIQAIIEEECTAFHAVPTMFKLVLNKIGDAQVSTLKKGLVSGSYCEPETLDAIRNRLGIKDILSLYGQSEGCGYTQIRLSDPIDKMLNTVGRPIEGVQVQIVDDEHNRLPINREGEVVVRTDYVMAGYYKNKEATESTLMDGWLYTGDLGKIDEEGYLTITGRKKDIIIRGGENISPIDIEMILRECEMIKEVVVVGVADEIMGQEIGACIIVSDKAKAVEEEMLIEHVREFATKHLAKYKRPKYIKLVESFPLTGSGKIQKAKLAKIAFN